MLTLLTLMDELKGCEQVVVIGTAAPLLTLRPRDRDGR